MDQKSSPDITAILLAWRKGDDEALARLIPLVYRELHACAMRYMASERTGHTLQSTALINEVYLRLADLRQIAWCDRAHFFAVCARLMRRTLVESARSRSYLKRGGQLERIYIPESELAAPARNVDLLALDEALDKLSRIDKRKSRVVELRFFAGLSVAETANVLELSNETVMRDWRFAKVWLLRAMDQAA